MYFLPKVAFAVAASALLANAEAPVAHAFPADGAVVASPAPSGVVKVHDERRTYRRYHRGYHRYPRGHVVDAPFAHVESGGHTVVDAPFVHVYRGRHGKHIVAPFVDLWEPR